MCLQEEDRLIMEEGEKVNLTTSTFGKDRKNSIGTNKGRIPTQPTIKKKSTCFFCKKKGHMKKHFDSFLIVG